MDLVAPALTPGHPFLQLSHIKCKDSMALGTCPKFYSKIREIEPLSSMHRASA